jgi:hypothetical protein
MPRMILLVVALSFLLIGCPTGGGKMSPYDTARTVLSYNPTALLVADSIVTRWAKRQTDAEKIGTVVAKYEKIKESINEGIAMALKSIDLAEEANKPINERELQAKVQLLVKQALDFALSLEDAITTRGPEQTPASAPTPTS